MAANSRRAVTDALAGIVIVRRFSNVPGRPLGKLCRWAKSCQTIFLPNDFREFDGLPASIDQNAAASCRPFRNFVGPDPKAREGIGTKRCCDRDIRRIPSPGH